MDNVDNPYTPNAGASREILIGRDDQTENFQTLLTRLSRGRSEQSMIITGLRGVGKAVLLNRFMKIATEAQWEVVEFEARKDYDDYFRQTMFSQLKSALLRLSPRARWTARGQRAAEVLSAFGISVDQPPAEGLVGLSS